MSKRNTYIRPMKANWWIQNPWFIRYMLREATSILVLLFCLQLFLAVRAIATSQSHWTDFLTWLQSPVSMIFHGVCLLAALLHTISWFNLAPKTMDIRIRGRKIDDSLVTKAHLIAFILFTLVIVIISGGWF